MFKVYGSCVAGSVCSSVYNRMMTDGFMQELTDPIEWGINLYKWIKQQWWKHKNIEQKCSLLVSNFISKDKEIQFHFSWTFNCHTSLKQSNISDYLKAGKSIKNGLKSIRFAVNGPKSYRKWETFCLVKQKSVKTTGRTCRRAFRREADGLFPTTQIWRQQETQEQRHLKHHMRGMTKISYGKKNTGDTSVTALHKPY